MTLMASARRLLGSGQTPGDIVRSRAFFRIPTYSWFTAATETRKATSPLIPCSMSQATRSLCRATSGGLVRAGYFFKGWNTQANGGGTAYAGGATFTYSGPITLYAQWQLMIKLTFASDPIQRGLYRRSRTRYRVYRRNRMRRKRAAEMTKDETWRAER